MATSKRKAALQSMLTRGPESQPNTPSFAGIDYGARTAGTSVIAWNEGRTIYAESSVAGRDADTFLNEAMGRVAPKTIAMDAPLSLPGVYRQLKGRKDFHLRECDRVLRAMSPMFLGGLTARAMALAAGWGESGIAVYETYPRQIAARLGLNPSSNLAPRIRAIFQQHGFRFSKKQPRITQHLIDAWLCLLPWCCSLPLEAIGDKQEGQIYLPRRS